MKPNNLSQLRMENIKRTKPQICEQGHKHIPVNGECLICKKDNVPQTMQSVSEEESGGGEKEYDFTRKRVFKL